jgi:hypothetical protein
MCNVCVHPNIKEIKLMDKKKVRRAKLAITASSIASGVVGSLILLIRLGFRNQDVLEMLR